MDANEFESEFRRMMEPMAIPTEAGVAFFQMFTTWRLGGFTEDQALTLLAKWMAEVSRLAAQNEQD